MVEFKANMGKAGKEGLQKLKANVKVLKTMKTLHKDLENFHRRKVSNKESLHKKITKELSDQFGDPQPVVVPGGLQVNQTLFVPKPLQCSLCAPFSSNDLYVAHYGAGPDNGVFMWSKSEADGRTVRTKKRLNCKITNLLFVPSGHVFFASCCDLTVRLFNNQFQEQSVLQLQFSILSMIYDEKRNCVITGSVGCIYRWKLPNCLHNTPALANELTLIDHVSGIIPWITFMHYNKEQDRFIALAGTALFFIDGESFEQDAFVENRHRFPLTVCLTYMPRQYLVTGKLSQPTQDVRTTLLQRLLVF